MAGLCQDCDGCCRVLEVHALGKAFHQPCKHLGQTSFGPGCTIYPNRPDVCWTYECVWLNSQVREQTERMPDNLRPNVCKVVMGNPLAGSREVMHIFPYPDHQDAWRFPPVSDYLRMLLSRGVKIVVVLANHRVALQGDMAVIGTEEEFARLAG